MFKSNYIIKMDKKLKIIIGVVVLVLAVAAAFFVFQKWQNAQKSKLGYLQFEDFTKQEDNGEIYYGNQESALYFKVPNSWTAIPSQLASVALNSSDFVDFKETDPARAFIPKTGCWIGLSVKNTLSDDADYAITKDRLEHQDIISTLNTSQDTYKIIFLGNRSALFMNHLSNSNKDNVGNFLSVEFIENNKYYRIDTSLFGKDQEKCSQAFDDFLKTVSLK